MQNLFRKKSSKIVSEKSDRQDFLVKKKTKYVGLNTFNFFKDSEEIKDPRF